MHSFFLASSDGPLHSFRTCHEPPASVDLEAVLRVLKNVDPSISNLPQIRTITDTSVKIVKIRDRITTNKKICYSIIDRVALDTTGLLAHVEQRGAQDCKQGIQGYERLLQDIHHILNGATLAGIPAIIKNRGIKKQLQECSTGLDKFDKLLGVSRFTDVLSHPVPNADRASLPTSVSGAILSTPNSIATARADNPSQAISRLVHAISTNLPDMLRIVKDVGESLQHIPYINSAAGIVVQILNIKEKVRDNKDLTDHLIGHVAARFTALLQSLEEKSETHLQNLQCDLERYEKLLVDIHEGLKELLPTGMITAVVNRDDVERKLKNFWTRLTEFDTIFIFSRLTSMEKILRKLNSGGQGTKSVHPPRAALVPPPSKTFTGRVEVLTKMAEYFSPAQSSLISNEQRVYVLYGLGGAGKTQIGLKFIKHHSEQFSRTHFIDASNIQSLANAFENMGKDAGLAEPSVAETLRWLGSLKEEWFLFYDNADDPSIDLHPYLPHCPHGNIVVTSRNPEMRQLAPASHYHVGILSQDEALLLLLRSSMRDPTDDEKAHARLLVQELGCLALAVAQAGAYMLKSQGVTFKRYREMYKTHRADLLRQKPGQNGDNYEWTVYTTWEMSFRRLSSLATQLLQLLSFWHYDRIPKIAFQNAALCYYDIPDDWKDGIEFVRNFTTAEGEWDDFMFQEVINELTSFSLLSSALGDMYSMHPLVHSWARDRNSSKDQQQSHLCAGHLLGLSIGGYDGTEPEIPFWQVIHPHMQSWIMAQSAWSASMNPDLATEFAHVYLEKGWCKEAEELALAAAEMRRKVLGSEHPATLYAMDRLARSYWAQGRWKEAEELLVGVLRTRNKILGNQHRDTLLSMHSLAVTYFSQGRWKEAEEMFFAVTETRLKILGDQHPNTLHAMANLSGTYLKQGKDKEADELGSHALEMMKKVLGDEHPYTLYTMVNVAEIYRIQGRLNEAEKLVGASLEKHKKFFGEEHPYTLECMANLAETFWDQGRLKEAEELGIDVLARRKQVLGADHPDTLASVDNLVKYQSRVS